MTLFSAVPLITSMATLLFPVETKVLSSSVLPHLMIYYRMRGLFDYCLEAYVCISSPWLSLQGLRLTDDMHSQKPASEDHARV